MNGAAMDRSPAPEPEPYRLSWVAALTLRERGGGVGATAFVTAVALAFAADDRGWVQASRSEVAAQARRSERTVQRGLAELERLGWVVPDTGGWWLVFGRSGGRRPSATRGDDLGD